MLAIISISLEILAAIEAVYICKYVTRIIKVVSELELFSIYLNIFSIALGIKPFFGDELL